MKRIAMLIMLVAVCFPATAGLTFASSMGTKAGLPLRPAYVRGELLVKYRLSVRAAASEYFITRWGVSTLRTFKGIDVQHVKLPKGMSVEQALEIYKEDPDVVYAEPNYYRYATATTPDDTLFTELWGLDNTGQDVNGTSGTADADIDAPEAWDITTGSSNVVIAVVDTGVDFDHPDLTDNIWGNSGETANNKIDDDVNDYIDDVRGWDFVDNDNGPMDLEGHGTHVAGTIAAKGNNTKGIAGVCWTAAIMPLRFLDENGSGTVADEVLAIGYAIDNGAKIINASFGSYYSSQAEYEAIARAREAGILFVAAAGNDFYDNDFYPHYPSSYDLDNIIAVAATDQDDSLAWFSNYGPTSVDVAAPGTNTYSSKPGVVAWSDDFESGGSRWNLDTWELTTGQYWSPTHSLTDSDPGNYANNINVSARNANEIDLSGRTGTRLNFKLRGKSFDGNDLLYVETDTDSGFGSPASRPILVESTLFNNGIWGDYSGRWFDAKVDLGTLDGEATAYFRFRFETDGSGTADGWYIDDVTITAYPEQYQYLDGTSMATPHVSGLAALIWSQDLGQTFAQVKGRIMNSVDRKPDLNGLLVTDGRIHAYNSIQDILAPPSNVVAKPESTSVMHLTWSDNYYGEVSFEIERKTGAGGTYSQIADVSTANYSDTGLSQSTTYYYRLRAYRDSDNSEYSPEVSATTPAPPSGGGDDGPCFIATAALGSPPDKRVSLLLILCVLTLRRRSLSLR